MSFADYLVQDQRLLILRLLAEMPAYRANSSVLVAALEQYGHAASRDQVKTQLAWLAEQGAIATETLGPVVVATLTERGQDIATGRCVAPGIKRPGA